MTRFTELGSTDTPAATIAYEYDAAGNIRRNTATYRTLDAQGVASGASTTTDYWFRFDSMNRVVTDKGVLLNGQILGGQDIQYNAAGERAAVISGGAREDYLYDAGGRLIEVRQAGVVRSRFSYDLLGRLGFAKAVPSCDNVAKGWGLYGVYSGRLAERFCCQLAPPRHGYGRCLCRVR